MLLQLRYEILEDSWNDATVILTALTQLMSEHVLYHSSASQYEASFNHPQVLHSSLLTFLGQKQKISNAKLGYGGLEVRGSSEQSTAIVCKVKKLAFMFTTQRCFSFLMKVGKQFVQKETAGENENKKREEEGAHHLRCKCKIYARLTLPLILCPEILCCLFAFFLYVSPYSSREKNHLFFYSFS